MQAQKPHFIVIDDSKLDCFIAEKMIRIKNPETRISVFTEATDALVSIQNYAVSTDDTKTILILDIRMPVMNGFEFVEAFEKLPASLRIGYTIFMITSSVNENDYNRINNYPSVRQLQSKPLTPQMLSGMIEQLHERC